MNKRLLGAILIFLCFQLSSFAISNLVENWDGNGDTDQSTSYPSTYGWDITTGSFNYANSGSGVRYTDVTSGHTLNGSNYSGRLMMVRWDGSGDTDVSSVFSYPVTLESNKRYAFSWIYEWWNNASSPVLTVDICTDKAGKNSIATADFNCSSRNLLQDGTFEFHVVENNTYYITIKTNNLASLCALGELSIIETAAKLEASSEAIELSYYNGIETIKVFPNGSTDEIGITAPAGIKLSAASLPATGGEVVISSADSSEVTGQIVIQQGADVVNIDIVTDFPEDFFKLSKIDTLNIDGAWCWFNDPRAIYHKGEKEQTYFGWINSVGDVVVASYNHETGEYVESTLIEKYEVDDHDNPAIFIRKDGHIIVWVSKHTSAPAHRFISSNAEDITSWNNDNYQFGVNVTYPYPFQVEDQIYVFYRGLNWHPTVVISDDNGATVGEPQQVVTGGGDRPYARYCQDKTGAIHMAFTTGHPRQEANNKIYYACYKNGAFYKADGTFIKNYTGTSTALNIDNNDAETVYPSDNGKGWIWDITVDSANNPVMVYASFPSDTDHRYHYARWDGSNWVRTEIADAGKWFPQTPEGAGEPEPNYSGGIALDYDDPSVLYLSKQVKGVFEIFKYSTPDKGATWKEQAITWNSPSDIVNVRPIVPRHHKKGFFEVVWMRGKYRYYQDYHTSLVYQTDSTVNVLDSITLSQNEMELKVGIEKQLTVTFYPFITSDKSIEWSSDNESVAVVNNGIVAAKNSGTATITATASTGVVATCKVSVLEPNYISGALFDFGTSTSPVAVDATKVFESTLLEDSYGWSSTVDSRDRGDGLDDETRDFNLSSSDVDFVVLVKPGTYDITIKQGDLSYPHDDMQVFVNGELKLSGISNAEGQIVTSDFEVTTTESYLKFTFADGGGTDANWVVNSLLLLETIPESTDSKEVSDVDLSRALMSVFDMNGKQIFQQKLDGQYYQTVLNNQHMLPGIYVVKLATSQTKLCIKYYKDLN